MLTTRLLRIAVLAAAIALALAAIAPAADGPAPVVKLTAAISPNHGKIKPHTSLTLKIDAVFKSVPAGGNFVLQSSDFLFPNGATPNGRLFPSCSVATLQKAKGTLSACPKGSKVGGGIATGTATALGITSTGKLTLFNGPGGKSITMNINVVRPAAINATWKAPYFKVAGKYAYKLEVPVPDSLKTILGGDIVVTEINVTTGATRVIGGVKRGFLEAKHCPDNGKAPLHADFTFNQGASTSADTTVAC